MKRIKVFLGIKDRIFSEKLNEFSSEVEIIEEPMSMEKIKKNVKKGEILLLDHMPPMGFCGLKARGVIVASKYSRRREFFAARSGAKGFLTRDIPKPILIKAIKNIAAGEIWMTRMTIARVFEEYANLRKELS